MKPFLFRILYKLQILRLFPQFYFHYEVKRYINRNDVVIDIGANQGIYTRIFKKCKTYVIAVEPINKFFNSIKRAGANIIMPVALGSEYKTVRMTKWRNSSGAYKISDEGEYEADMLMASDNFHFNDLEKINFIKIDVEGSELPIIQDMAELILKHKPTILIETERIEEVLRMLKGYKTIDQLNNDYLICPKD